MSGRVWRFSEIEKVVQQFDNVQNGIIADTNIIFSGSYELDHFNAEVAELFNSLKKLNIALFANVNIRIEFLDLHRRVLIAECLIDMYEAVVSDLAPSLDHQLKSLRTRYRTAVKEGRLFKLSDKEIKNLRLSMTPSSFKGADGWEIFCENYLFEKMSVVWDLAVKEFGVNMLSLREGERSPQINGDISWEEMIKLVSRFGIGVSDAMILNLFLNSNFRILATADTDIIYCMEKLKKNDKIILIPNSLKH